MKSILLLSIVLYSLPSFSQNSKFEAPNYKKIEKSIQKNTTNLFYDSLMTRFQKADSTMTLEEKRHLYYGFSFQPEYTSYPSSDYDDSLSTLLRKETLSDLEFQKILEFGDSILLKNPFNLKTFIYQLYALDHFEDTTAFNNKITQYRIIIDALLSSGNGKTKKNAFYVIYIGHEYELLSVLDLESDGSQSLIDQCDYLTVKKNEQGIEGLYFDISPSLEATMKMFEK